MTMTDTQNAALLKLRLRKGEVLLFNDDRYATTALIEDGLLTLRQWVITNQTVSGKLVWCLEDSLSLNDKARFALAALLQEKG